MAGRRQGWAGVPAGLPQAQRRTGETSPQAWASLPAKSLDREGGNWSAHCTLVWAPQQTTALQTLLSK